MSEELNQWEKEAIEEGDLTAKWVRGKAPVARDPPTMNYISWRGINYGKELPERLKEEGVEVVNTEEDAVREYKKKQVKEAI